MYLKSQGFASNLSDPVGTHTLEAFCQATGRPYADYGLPVALDTFVAYGDWFAAEHSAALEQVLVTGITGREGQFELSLDDGSTAVARRVVLAAGVEHFAYTPQQLTGHDNVRHSSTVTEPADFAGQRVAVVGRGQSALETAALLQENGAEAQIVTRSAGVKWNGPPLLPDRPLRHRMREPEAGLGSGWGTWFYSNHPELFRRLPERTRIYRARTALGPAGASWLRERVDGQIEIRAGQAVDGIRAHADGVILDVTSRSGGRSQVHADQVIAATGYRPDLRRLSFLDPAMRAGLQTVAGTAAVDASYQTSVPGMFMIGPAVAPVFGPVMRFVYGSAHAAATVARRLTATAESPAPMPAPSLAGVAGR
jgi:thioredoxin reductase